MSEEPSKLAAMIDGALLPEEDAKALWREFSEHMEANRGDMAGFAVKKGWFAIAPEYRGGKAVLIARTTATSKAPAPAPAQAPQKPRPQPGQKAQQRPKQPLKPKPHGGGGQAPPRKRSV